MGLDALPIDIPPRQLVGRTDAEQMEAHGGNGESRANHGQNGGWSGLAVEITNGFPRKPDTGCRGKTGGNHRAPDIARGATRTCTSRRR